MKVDIRGSFWVREHEMKIIKFSFLLRKPDTPLVHNAGDTASKTRMSDDGGVGER